MKFVEITIMKKRISFNVIIRGADGPTVVRVSIKPHPLIITAVVIATLAVGISVITKMSK